MDIAQPHRSHKPPQPPRRVALRRSALLASLAVLLPVAAHPFEALDGDLQFHGYLETQVRAISRNFDTGDGLDLTQWYLIANLETEWDIAPKGFGPFDALSAFVRVEARYDCVWTRACGMFQGANSYGNRAEHLPDRLSNARKTGAVGQYRPSRISFLRGVNPDPANPNAFLETEVDFLDLADTRRRIGIPLGQGGDEFAVGPGARSVPHTNGVGRLWQVPALGELFFQPGTDVDGVDGALNPIGDLIGTDDDISGCLTGNRSALACRFPGAYVAESFIDHRFGLRSQPGNTFDNGTRVFGPWRPKDKVVGVGTLRDRVNPYNPNDIHPVMTDDRDALPGPPLTGFGALPFRPAAKLNADTDGDGLITPSDDVGPFVSRGLYYPNRGLLTALSDRDFDQPATNFGETRLAWNQGDSQKQTRELKEAFLDIETLDNRLWLRLGRQTIVWGKTELFRSQDQFNPQDLGLTSLPSLEESRVPLWAARGIYSLYDVGPLEDVRLEVGVLFDRFQPVDLGHCGEPYAPPQTCDRNFGLFAHGVFGLGLAGEYRPDAPWNDAGNIEGGVRIEWRWGRYSFSLSDFYGYDDLPHVELLWAYERNVDPLSGRPRRAGATGTCAIGNEAACLGGAVAGDDPTDPAFASFPGIARPDPDDVLIHHHANQQLFATICAATVNTSSALPEGCAFNLWNSMLPSDPANSLSPSFAQAFAAVLTGLGYAERLEGTGLPGASGFNGHTVFVTLGRFDRDRDPPANISLPIPFPRPAPFFEADRYMPLVPLHVNSNPLGSVDSLGNPDLGPDGGVLSADRLDAFPGVELSPGRLVVWRNVGLDGALTDVQEGLIGCGDFWGTDCDVFGFDVLNAEGSALLQSFPGLEGSGGADWDTFDGDVAQPGTIYFDGGPLCTRFVPGQGSVTLPGCRGARDHEFQPLHVDGPRVLVTFDHGYDPNIDGCVFAPTIDGNAVVGRYPDESPVDLSPCVAREGHVIRTLYHPFAGCLTAAELRTHPDAVPTSGSNLRPGICNLFNPDDPSVPARNLDREFLGLVPGHNAQVFRNELAALSWNFLMVLVATSLPPDKLQGGAAPCDDSVGGTRLSDGCRDRPPRFDEFDSDGPRPLDANGERIDDFSPTPQRTDGCSFRKPLLCKNVAAFLVTTGQTRDILRAGGNGRFGRRDFTWHGGSVVTLDYNRRNVLGFSMDFAEDRTKTNWGVEFTWVDRAFLSDADEADFVTESDLYNLSISVDRPTFLRFLNPARTFFINSQVFFQYIREYRDSFSTNGPLNTIMTLAVNTGYWQDRLLPSLLFAHDFPSRSGAVIGTLTYRYNQNFSISVGAAGFYGRVQSKDPSLTGLAGPPGGAGPGSQRSYVENGLSSIRDRDELFLRLRYTF